MLCGTGLNTWHDSCCKLAAEPVYHTDPEKTWTDHISWRTPCNPLSLCFLVPLQSLQGLQEAGVGRVLAWEEFLQLGADNPRDAIPPSASDTSTIM